LRAGSAPGLSNLAVVETGQRTFSASGVPPGRYYVRVAALSAQGPGAESNEVTLVVP
jgi:hypothetical protein